MFTLAKNQPFGANWWEDINSIMLPRLHINPSNQGRHRKHYDPN